MVAQVMADLIATFLEDISACSPELNLGGTAGAAAAAGPGPASPDRPPGPARRTLSQDAGGPTSPRGATAASPRGATAASPRGSAGGATPAGSPEQPPRCAALATHAAAAILATARPPRPRPPIPAPPPPPRPPPVARTTTAGSIDMLRSMTAAIREISASARRGDGLGEHWKRLFKDRGGRRGGGRREVVEVWWGGGCGG
jgi:hypothetical protein